MGTSYALFSPGGAAEAFFLIRSSSGSDFSGAASEVLSRLESAVSETGSSLAHAMMTRVYLRGGKHAREAFRATRLYRELAKGAVSIVAQDPLEGGPIALFSQHIFFPSQGSSHPGSAKKRLPAGTLLQGNYSHLWLNHLPLKSEAEGMAAQTAGCLGAWNRELGSLGMDWPEHVFRTWFFIDAIDANYEGMVRARRDFFSQQGLTRDRRYPASTGIGAQGTGGTDKRPGLAAELLALQGHAAGQIQAMRDERNMPSAMSYGVAFERGIKVRYGDRIHCHISGTASIGRQGEILHPGDVDRQTAQTLENVESLLATEGLGLFHLAYLLVYIRDAASAPRVRAILDRRLPPTVPSLILEGAVCRPGWLVEAEGLALQAQASPFKNFP